MRSALLSFALVSNAWRKQYLSCRKKDKHENKYLELRILELVALDNKFHIPFYIVSNYHKQLKTLPLYHSTFRIHQIMKKTCDEEMFT